MPCTIIDTTLPPSLSFGGSNADVGAALGDLMLVEGDILCHVPRKGNLGEGGGMVSVTYVNA